MQSYIDQRWRFFVFVANCVVFYAAFWVLTGSWRLTGGGESVWFLSAVAVWALNLLSAPWYRPPKDALASGIAACFALATIELPRDLSFYGVAETARVAFLTYAVVVAAAALMAGILAHIEKYDGVRRAAFAFGDQFGRGEFLFGSAALISIFGFYSGALQQFALTTLWFFFVIGRPFELAVRVFGAAKKTESDAAAIGTLTRIDHPNIVRALLNSPDDWKEGALFVTQLADGRSTYVLPLFTQAHGGEVLATGICTGQAPEDRKKRQVGRIYPSDAALIPALLSELSGSNEDTELVGFVVERSSIGAIRFEVARNSGLEEGSVVFCNLPEGKVYYQVLDAETAEESFEQNPRGTHIALATQLGQLDSTKGFVKFAWLPPMNTPLFKPLTPLKTAAEVPNDEFIIGNVASTEIKVRASLDDIVTYHCAVLGATGTGKTELALDIVREALKRNTKVVCVDLTGEYRRRLEDLKPASLGFDEKRGNDLEQKLFAVETGTYGAPTEKKVLKEFLDQSRDYVRQSVSEFLDNDNEHLAVFEVAEVTNTRATLRTTELYLSEIMLWARKNRKKRRILIVLEEAHTIIPETAGSGFDFDTQWVVSRIGQIALQGRKYGVGLLVVSQRTALVSKTILSQCHTYFTHSLVDQTSLGYLTNIYSSLHVNAIPNLRFLEFLAFGKGVRCERPMLLKRDFDDAKLKASQALDAKPA